jgi:hypothetical protein
MHRWLWWLPRDSADTGRYGRWRRWLRTARCDGGVARPLHAEDHSPLPPGLKRANAGPTESGSVLERGPSLPGLRWPSFRRAIDDSAASTSDGSRSRTPQPWVGSRGDSPFDPTALADRPRMYAVVCPTSEDRFSTPCTGPPESGVQWESAKRITANWRAALKGEIGSLAIFEDRCA